MTYGDKTALDDLGLHVERGSITALLGRNGAGKTTLLETCEGYRRPDAGTVRVLGLDPVADRAALMPRIGVMLQSGGAWSGVRAVEMLEHLARLHADPVPTALLVDRLGLTDCGSTPYRRLSGGQQQRLSLAMALVGRPELLFVDEPTAGMDPGARRTTWELLEEVRADGATVVLTTHYLDEAERLADTVHILDRGRLVASGSPATLTASTGTIRLVASEPLPASAAEQLAAHLSVRAAAATVTATDATTLLVAGDVDLDHLGAVVAWCREHGVGADQLTLGRRTLEDVFLDLTRVAATPPAQPAADPGVVV
ncbi:ABC transporter ATP-binding protein [Nocardioidaceae bacterium]|nr:ABC transporter ATP-binding protein [Nocardioidaceae bacterium]